jgi:5'-nucleotidase
MAKKKLTILLSNDDGIHAPGLKALEKIAHALSDDIWIVAPATEQSGTAHSLTLHKPLRCRELDPKKYAVEGTPTDCILMAVEMIMKGNKPDLILSGVNAGSNMGEDVNYSGTVAAAMEGVSFNIPSIAMSQSLEYGSPIKWQTAIDHAPDVIRKLLDTGWPTDILLNMNFPNVVSKSVEGVEVTRQGSRPPYKSVIRNMDPRGKEYFWIGAVPEKVGLIEGTDLAVVHNRKISITPLHLDLTHTKTLQHLQQKAFK